MSKPNVHGLPQHLRKDDKGYFLDYFVMDGGLRKRKRVRLGLIPVAQAKRILAEHTKEIVAGEFLPGDKPKMSFDEAADSFLAYSKARKKTFRNDAQIVERLKTFFGNRPLESLTVNLVDAYLLQRRQQGSQVKPGKTLKNATLNRDVACLKTIVSRAVLNRQLERDPIVGLQRFKEHSRDRTLSAEEYQALLNCCSPHLRNIVELAYWTAMRRGEILGLRWDQVDFKNGVITLEAADTKTQEKREIPLNEKLIALFQRIPRTLGSPYVFFYQGKRVKDPRNGFATACRKAGIEDFRFHDLRHCAVTNFRKAGVSDTVIMSISGHKTYAVFRRYDRVDREDRKAALGRMAGLIDTVMTPGTNQQAQA
jgi:integrase